MAKKRSPERDKAFEIYKQNKKLIDIAKELNLPEGTIRGWKNKDKWDDKLNGTFQKDTERSVKKLTPKKEERELKKLDLNEAELTEKQKLFCLYYIKSFNATMAAIKAGYSKDTAYYSGYENLRKPKIAAEIKRLKGQIVSELYIDAMDVLEKYIKIAFSDITDFVTFGQRQQQVVGMYGPVYEKDEKDENDENKPVMETVNYVDLKESDNIDGTLISEVSMDKKGVKIKLTDKMKALDKLAEYFDLFPDKFKRKIEEEKILLLKRRVGDDEGEEIEDDGFIEALKAETGKVWDDKED